MLSVIIPFYRAKETIERCVNSVLEQNIEDLEIIIVDDGSDDGGDALCDDIAKREKRIKVIHSENKGIFGARLNGVLQAKGDIITFVDADDWVDQGAYVDLIEQFYNSDVDVLLYTYKYENSHEVISHDYAEGNYDKQRLKEEVLPSMMWDVSKGKRRLDPSLCCKLMKRNLYLKTTKGVNCRIVLGEDAVVTYPVICASNRIRICNRPYYNYCTSEKSSTRSFPLTRVEEIRSFKNVLKTKLLEFSDFNFEYQIDCYVRIFVNMMTSEWFGCLRTSQLFSFPFSLLSFGESIRLYGAGDVGKSYYVTIKQTGYVRLNGWYDVRAQLIGSYNGEAIKEPSAIEIKSSERILIAVKDEAFFRTIRSELINMGINEDRIIWSRPQIIG